MSNMVTCLKFCLIFYFILKQACESIQTFLLWLYIQLMDNTFLQRLGMNIKKYRLKANLTQENLAEIVNIHPTYVGKLEAGKNNPSVKTLFKITSALKITLCDLFDFDKR